MGEGAEVIGVIVDVVLADYDCGLGGGGGFFAAVVLGGFVEGGGFDGGDVHGEAACAVGAAGGVLYERGEGTGGTIVLF
eukprot:CAMPEP_0182514264 /NCGR_PEP_ID=MMETSP1321-20130603/35428_1 /TAXON_ID=91990 /ORGANISM="Bolidomonas sp., Strain RCC1657" /LENGTH=78 /DNA_ID=CAMNT_0024721421 /DNA_START=279 /DNA_END=515 /DNA_ORIENTATION=+